jgi:hypothetical protein
MNTNAPIRVEPIDPTGLSPPEVVTEVAVGAGAPVGGGIEDRIDDGAIDDCIDEAPEETAR